MFEDGAFSNTSVHISVDRSVTFLQLEHHLRISKVTICGHLIGWETH